VNALTILSPGGLPPARRALVDITRRINDARRHLDRLQSGKAALERELGRVVEAKAELQSLVAADAESLVDRLRAGASWVLSGVTQARTHSVAAQLNQSRVEASVGEAALSSVTGEIASLDRQIAELKQSKTQAVRAVLVEVASGYRADLNSIADEMRQLMVILSSLDKFTAVPDGEYRPDRRITVTIPSVGGVREQNVVAPTTATAQARNIWSAFAAELDKDPLATVEHLEFPHVVGDEDVGKVVYSDLAPSERAAVDRAYAQQGVVKS
jgi:prefoldin subunit 5